MSAVQTRKRGRLKKPVGADWSSLPAPAIYLIMKSLLPASPADVFSTARVCKAWKSVFRACRRDLLSSMPPIAVHVNLEAQLATTNEGRWSPPPGAARPWVRPEVLAASHGHLFVADNGSDLSCRRIFLLEAVAALTGEETPVIALPRIPFDTAYLALHLTAHPASPRCVVVVLVDQEILLCCRIGDRRWTAEYYIDDDNPDHIYELCTAILTSSMVAVDGKIYGMTQEGMLLIAESFFPHLNISVMDLEGLPPKEPFPLCFMVESGGDILCFIDDPDDEVDIEAMGTRSWRDRHLNIGAFAFRLDLAARRWVRADAALGDGSRAFLHNNRGDCLSWEAGGSGDEGRVFVRRWGVHSGVVTVYHMKHGLVERRKIDYAGVFFLPAACYAP